MEWEKNVDEIQQANIILSLISWDISLSSFHDSETDTYFSNQNDRSVTEQWWAAGPDPDRRNMIYSYWPWKHYLIRSSIA